MRSVSPLAKHSRAEWTTPNAREPPDWRDDPRRERSVLGFPFGGARRMPHESLRPEPRALRGWLGCCGTLKPVPGPVIAAPYRVAG